MPIAVRPEAIQRAPLADAERVHFPLHALHAEARLTVEGTADRRDVRGPDTSREIMFPKDDRGRRVPETGSVLRIRALEPGLPHREAGARTRWSREL
jgi:hypothetical protein